MSWSKPIEAWQRATFGEATTQRALDRSSEEWAELTAANDRILQDPSNQEIAAEAADVVITLVAFVATLGFDLAEEVERKMAKNRARKWHSNGDGTGYHIKEGT